MSDKNKKRPSVIERFLVWWNNVSQAFERVFIDNIAATTPWLAPLIPAYLAYHNMINYLGFSRMMSLVGAVIIEFLGLVAINTAVEFWKFNNEKRKTDDNAPAKIAIATGAFYIVIVLTVNAVLDVGIESGVNVFAKALLSLLSVDAAVIIAVRAQHRRQLLDIAEERERRRENRGVHPASTEIPVESPKTTIPDYETYARFCETRNGDGPISVGELMDKYGVPRSSAYKWHSQYKAAHVKS